MTTETFELVPASETCWSGKCDPDDIMLMLVERAADGEELGGSRIGTFSNARFMNSLGARLAKLCQETAQAELDRDATASRRPSPKRAASEPFARLGDDVVVSDFDWKNPLMIWPGTWLFHDVKRDRPMFQVRKSDVGADPSVEVLVALLLAFSAGERTGRDAGREDGRVELASEMRKLIGMAA